MSVYGEYIVHICSTAVQPAHLTQDTFPKKNDWPINVRGPKTARL